MSSTAGRWLAGVGLAMALATGAMLRWAWQPATAVDQVGYRAAGELLAAGQGLAWHDEHNRPGARYYSLLAFAAPRGEEPDLYFNYPPGLPALAAILAAATGQPEAADWAVPLSGALLAGAVVYLGGRELRPAAGIWAGLALMLSPALITFGSAWWSEVPGAALAYGGLALYLAGRGRLGRARPGWVAWALAALAGLVSGGSFFVRLPNLSALPGLCLVAWALSADGPGKAHSPRPTPQMGRASPNPGWLCRILRRGTACHAPTEAAPPARLQKELGILQGWRGPIWAYIGALFVMALGLALFNTWFYGGPLRTGYMPENNWYADQPFALEYAFGASFAGQHSVMSVLRMLWHDRRWMLLASALGLALAAGRERRLAWALAGLAACALAPYLVYAIHAYRFILTALPALCLLEGLGLAHVLEVLPRPAWRWLAVAALGVALCWRLPTEREDLLERNAVATRALVAARADAALTEPDAVIVAFSRGDLLRYYGGRSVLNWRRVAPYDPVQKRFRTDLFAGLLQDEVARLLARGEHVYYLFDAGEPSQTVAGFLRERFMLAPVPGSEALYYLRLSQ